MHLMRQRVALFLLPLSSIGNIDQVVNRRTGKFSLPLDFSTARNALRNSGIPIAYFTKLQVLCALCAPSAVVLQQIFCRQFFFLASTKRLASNEAEDYVRRDFLPFISRSSVSGTFVLSTSNFILFYFYYASLVRVVWCSECREIIVKLTPKECVFFFSFCWCCCCSAFVSIVWRLKFPSDACAYGKTICNQNKRQEKSYMQIRKSELPESRMIWNGKCSWRPLCSQWTDGE